jgi:MEMO1 family protein
MKNPQLRRDIQPIPFTAGERRMISFNDPLRLVQSGIAIDQRAIPFLRLLDGTRDLKDIQAELMRQGGSLIPMSEIEEFIKVLDESRLLESEAFSVLKQTVQDEFARATEREHCLAGKSYAASAEELTAGIGEAEGRITPLDAHIASQRVRGILAPHIDIAVAHDAYVNAYRYLKGRNYDLVIILGINHNGSGGLWSISDKSYATPFGPLHTDREFIAGLKARLPQGALTSSDFDHKHEHSVEFQTVFLSHYLKDGPKIVPILCGGIHEFVHSGKSPLSDGRFLAMKGALNELVGERWDRTLLVSGVDFSHVGLKFGHDHPAEELMGRASAYDGKIIQALLAGRPEEIFSHAAASRDYCNVCGLPSMLLFSWLLGPCMASLLKQGTYDEKATRSAVTYASMVFYDEVNSPGAGT